MVFLAGVENVFIIDSTLTVEALTISGNLTVLGSQSILNTESVSTNDSIITLQQDFTSGTPTESGGLIVRTGLSTNALFNWNESTDTWQSGISGSTVDVPTESYVQGLVSERIPTGAVRMYGGTVAPTGWLLCDGAILSSGSYPNLSSVLGSTYNIGGEGAGNFRIPDLRQRFPIGKADSGTASTLGQTSGSISHSHTMSHTHTMGNHSHSLTHSHSMSHTHTIPGHRHGKGSLAIAGGGEHAHFTETINCGTQAPGYGLGGGGQYIDQILIWSNFGAGNPSVTLDTDSSSSSHNHVITGLLGNTAGSNGDSNFSTVGITKVTTDSSSPSTSGISTNTTGGSSQTNTATENPPYISLNFIIKV